MKAFHIVMCFRRECYFCFIHSSIHIGPMSLDLYTCYHTLLALPLIQSSWDKEKIGQFSIFLWKGSKKIGIYILRWKGLVRLGIKKYSSFWDSPPSQYFVETNQE